MSWRDQLSPILDNQRITHGLDDAEARMLIEWLVEHAAKTQEQADVRRLCLRARAIARFVAMWCYEHLACSALQLAATERFTWPLPSDAVKASDLMREILAWEDAGPAAERE